MVTKWWYFTCQRIKQRKARVCFCWCSLWRPVTFQWWRKLYQWRIWRDQSSGDGTYAHDQDTENYADSDNADSENETDYVPEPSPPRTRSRSKKSTKWMLLSNIYLLQLIFECVWQTRTEFSAWRLLWKTPFEYLLHCYNICHNYPPSEVSFGILL